MTDFRINVRKWCKVFAIVLTIFMIFWVGMNLSVVFGAFNIDVNNIVDVIGDKYHNCLKMVGMIVPIIYSVSFGYLFIVDENYIMLRYGRNRYEKKEINKVFVFSVVFASEYMGVDLLFMDIFAGVSTLSDCSYYLYMLLKFIMLIFYLTMIGMTLLFLRNIMNFSGIYVVFGGMIYVFLTALYYIFMTINLPAFYMGFGDEWFASHIFDSFSYIINLAKLFFASLIFRYLGKLVFLKRDIIGNEDA